MYRGVASRRSSGGRRSVGKKVKVAPLQVVGPPAMAAGLTDHVWKIEDMLAMMDGTAKVG